MARAVIILHPSEIIRKGVLTVLENEIVSTIFCIEHIGDIKNHVFVTYAEIIFILPLTEYYSELFLNLKNKTNSIALIGVDSGNSISFPQHFDFIFNINDPAQDLVHQINTYYKDTSSETNDDELTVREKEVLRLIALGHTNKSIAENLFISTHTVISHRKNITEKLGIKSIPGLTVYAIIQKIISQADITNNQLS